MSRKSSRRKTPEKKRNPYLRVFKLYLPSSKWKFDGHFPKDIIEESDPNLHVKGKLWWIKQKIRTHTYFKDQIEPITRKYIHPEGFCVFPPLATSRLFNNVYDNLTDLYKTEFPRSSPQATQFEVNGYD